MIETPPFSKTPSGLLRRHKKTRHAAGCFSYRFQPTAVKACAVGVISPARAVIGGTPSPQRCENLSSCLKKASDVEGKSYPTAEKLHPDHGFQIFAHGSCFCDDGHCVFDRVFSFAEFKQAAKYS
jgi:hypothetical protein